MADTGTYGPAMKTKYVQARSSRQASIGNAVKRRIRKRARRQRRYDRLRREDGWSDFMGSPRTHV